MLNLSQMAEGAFIEQFSRELAKVLKNIADPNTEPKKKRKVILTAVLEPDENREIINFEVQSKCNLVPPKALSTTIMIDKDTDGKIVGAELRSKIKGQSYIDEKGNIRDDRGQVIDFNKKA